MSDKKNSKAIFFILVTVLIDVIGIGIIIPIMPSLYQELTGGTISEASKYSAYLVFIYALMQFIFSPIIGGLSDQYGRRPVLLMSLFGFGLDSDAIHSPNEHFGIFNYLKGIETIPLFYKYFVELSK